MRVTMVVRARWLSQIRAEGARESYDAGQCDNLRTHNLTVFFSGIHEILTFSVAFKSHSH
jgi:hypothetical protein